MIEQQHSRLPVYEEPAGADRRHPVLQGSAAGLGRAAAPPSAPGRLPRIFRVSRLMRKHLVVPETKPLSQMLAEFQQGHSHMAMVVDEFGTIVRSGHGRRCARTDRGRDRRRIRRKRACRRRPEGDELELEGATKIRDLESQYGIALPGNGGFETLAGFLLMRLGNIPTAGRERRVRWPALHGTRNGSQPHRQGAGRESGAVTILPFAFCLLPLL